MSTAPVVRRHAAGASTVVRRHAAGAGIVVRRHAVGAGIAAIAALAAGALHAQEPPTPVRHHLNLYGMTGLIDMPTAFGQPDGELTLTAAGFGPYLRNTFAFQILPGVQGAFRYAVLDDFDAARNTLYDRSFDVQATLVREGPWWPEVAVGLRDFLGTGIYSSEYIVASKHLLGGRLVATGGVGWGRLSEEIAVDNPLCLAFDGACERETSETTGEVRLGRFFRGEDVGLFGGLEWRTPIEGLSAMVELSTDTYARDSRFTEFEPRIPLNFGLAWRPLEGIEIAAYVLYGDAAGLRVSFAANPDRPLLPPDAAPAALPIVPRAPAPTREDRFGAIRDAVDATPARAGADVAAGPPVATTRRGGVRWAEVPLAAGVATCPVEEARRVDARLGLLDGVTFRLPDGTPLCTVVLRLPGRAHVQDVRARTAARDTGWVADPAVRARAEEALRARLAEDGLTFESLALSETAATLAIRNPRYNAGAQAIGRASGAMAGVLPPSVEDLEVVLVEAGLPVVSVALRRTTLETAAIDADGPRRAWLGATVGDAPVAIAQDAFPRLDWEIGPYIPINLFDPDDPLRVDLQLRGTGTVEVAPGLSLTGSVTQRLVGQLDDITRPSDSTLPRVRSDFRLYFQQDTALERLTGDWLFKLAPDTYGRVSVGYLERMFAGVSAEALWKPAAQSWGLGAELNWSRQRAFEGIFELQDYDVVTGHASVYWDTGFHGLEAQVDAGRYLAGDWGATFSLSRRFANGWEVGAFFTLTDVPFDEFGEGSFDRGIRVTIPLDWMLLDDNRTRISSVIRPLTRDGGQRLEIADRLWPIVRENDAGGLREDWGSFFK